MTNVCTFFNKMFISQYLCHLVREKITFFEDAKNLNARSEKFGDLGLTAGI